MIVRTFFAVIVSMLLLSGCGIKPDTLAPPESAESVTFPRTYPDPASTLPQLPSP